MTSGLHAGPDVQVAVVRDDPDRRGYRCAVPAEAGQADIALASQLVHQFTVAASASAAEDGQVGFGDAAGVVDDVDRDDLCVGGRERLE